MTCDTGGLVFPSIRVETFRTADRRTFNLRRGRPDDSAFAEALDLSAEIAVSLPVQDLTSLQPRDLHPVREVRLIDARRARSMHRCTRPACLSEYALDPTITDRLPRNRRQRNHICFCISVKRNRNMRRCENCDQMIGNLEQPLHWEGHVVCAACHARLSHAQDCGNSMTTSNVPTTEPAIPTKGLNSSAKWGRLSFGWLAASLIWALFWVLKADQAKKQAIAEGRDWLIPPKGTLWPGMNELMAGVAGIVFVGLPTATICALVGVTRREPKRRLSTIAFCLCVMIWIITIYKWL